MYAWAGNQTQPGGFYRVRYTGKPIARAGWDCRRDATGIAITFTGALDRKTATDSSRYSVRVWGLKRTENYGSDHIDERPLDRAGRQPFRRRAHGRALDIRTWHRRGAWRSLMRSERLTARKLTGEIRQHDPPDWRDCTWLLQATPRACDSGRPCSLPRRRRRRLAGEVLADVGCGPTVAERAVGEQGDFAREQRRPARRSPGRRPCAVGTRRQSLRRTARFSAGSSPAITANSVTVAEQEIERDQALAARGRLALEHGLRWLRAPLCRRAVKSLGRSRRRAEECGRGQAVARGRRVVVDVLLPGDQRFVASAGEEESPLLRVGELVDHDRAPARGPTRSSAVRRSPHTTGSVRRSGRRSRRDRRRAWPGRP